MASKEYVGIIVMELDGQEIEIESLDVTEKLNRKLVKTMNRDARARGFASGVSEIDLKVEAVIPKSGEPDWAAITNAKITIYPQSGGGKRESFIDCFTVEVGSKYTLDKEAMRSLTMNALRKVVE